MIRKAIAALVGSCVLVLSMVTVAAAAPGDSSDPSISVLDTTATEVAGTVVTNTSIEVLPTHATQSSPGVSNTATASTAESTHSIEVLPANSTQPSKDLSYTGVPFNVPLTLGIAVLILLGGAVLIWIGSRRLQTRRVH